MSTKCGRKKPQGRALRLAAGWPSAALCGGRGRGGKRPEGKSAEPQAQSKPRRERDSGRAQQPKEPAQPREGRESREGREGREGQSRRPNNRRRRPQGGKPKPPKPADNS